MFDDNLHEECGVYAIRDHQDAAALTALGLHALQHRGQEAAGIISCNKGHFYHHNAIGLVGDNFNSQEVIDSLEGSAAIGHVRYSTTGGKFLRNVQPLFAELHCGGIALAHNGNLTNVEFLKRQLIKKGCIFQTTMDSEIFIHLIATSQEESIENRLVDALKQVEGAYSLAVMTDRVTIGVRDPYGVRPMVLGKLQDAYIIASESCALDIVGATYVRDVEAGEMVIIEDGAVRSERPFTKKSPRFCIFEYVYFSRPDSIIESRDVYQIRKNIGRELAKEFTGEADLVVPVPDSGVAAAIGFAEEINLPFELGIVRNHYVGRTFIEPTDQVRHLGVKLKHNANQGVLKGKRVILIDDSIVRGTTSKKIVEMVRQAGAHEIHMCIASPPTAYSCFYGVDTPAQSKLLAHAHDNSEMAALIGVDGLTFISVDGLYRATGEAKRDNANPQFCDACFTGDYPIPLVDKEKGLLGRESLVTEMRRGKNKTT